MAKGRLFRGVGFAARLFVTPPRIVLRDRQRAFLESARPLELEAAGHRVVGFSWGAGPTVYLVHGWGGRAVQLGSFVKPLVEGGFRVVAYDAPAHGESGGRVSSLPALARTLGEVVEQAGPAYGVVGHSLGAAAIALALAEGVTAMRAVLLAPPTDNIAAIARFAHVVGVRVEDEAELRRAIERRVGRSLEDVALVPKLPRVDAEVLVFHDGEDPEVPFSEGEMLARLVPNGEIVRTSGLGHHRIARDPSVVRSAVRFLVGDGAGGTEQKPWEP